MSQLSVLKNLDVLLSKRHGPTQEKTSKADCCRWINILVQEGARIAALQDRGAATCSPSACEGVQEHMFLCVCGLFRPISHKCEFMQDTRPPKHDGPQGFALVTSTLENMLVSPLRGRQQDEAREKLRDTGRRIQWAGQDLSRAIGGGLNGIGRAFDDAVRAVQGQGRGPART